MTHRTSESYPCTSLAPGQARAFCTAELPQVIAERGPAAPPADVGAVLDTARLIVSELLTNAVDARCGQAQVTLSAHDHCVRVAVDDDAGGAPTAMRAADTDVRGRGLLIVAALAEAWGVESSPLGKRVWADIPF